jgi:heat-inducible transcriptional repressor
MNELTPRQKMVLRLVVREYVRNAVPVSSRRLADRYGLEVSTATIRNDLARLEDLGYLTHPHTSAGRVPTVEGYRFFVGRLMGEVSLPLQERRTIIHQFHQAPRGLDQWMPLAASILTRTSRGAALVTAPLAVQTAFKHLQLISTQGRMVLLVLVLRGGIVTQQILNLAEPMEQGDLSAASDRLNKMCDALSADEVRALFEEMPSFDAEIARFVVGVMDHNEQRAAGVVYRDGLSALLQEPEFSGGENAQGLVRVMEERNRLDTILEDVLGPDVGSVRVLIGGEGRWEDLEMCSLILARYGVAGFATGALGVVGPIRMAYGRAISGLRFVAELLSDMVYDMYTE